MSHEHAQAAIEQATSPLKLRALRAFRGLPHFAHRSARSAKQQRFVRGFFPKCPTAEADLLFNPAYYPTKCKEANVNSRETGPGRPDVAGCLAFLLNLFVRDCNAKNRSITRVDPWYTTAFGGEFQIF